MERRLPHSLSSADASIRARFARSATPSRDQTLLRCGADAEGSPQCSRTIFEPASQQGGAGDSGGGSADGVIGGALEGVPGGIPLPDDGRLHIDRDKPLPLVAIYREYPDYPERERLAGKQATVVVRYVIGKDGWIRQLDILLHAEQAAFDEATLKALRMWRFQPMLQDGKPVEVVHELTVIYQLAYR
ncbi:MAG: hypothetical protein DMF58_12540 [Acidobacteria bacterium]|nr:MAG: hypothetical protein DMF58_12540 [Acidobacteriota bacterium]